MDFSEESILLKFRNAGLEIRDVVNKDGTIDQVPALNLEGEPILDENGNPTYRNKTEIYMNADQFRFNIADNKAMTLGGLFNDNGQFIEAVLDVNGWIQSRGLSVGHEVDGEFQPFFTVSKYGNIWAQDCDFKKVRATNIKCWDITAYDGQIGGFKLNKDGSNRLEWETFDYGGGTDKKIELGWASVNYSWIGSDWETCIKIQTGVWAMPIMVFTMMGAGIFTSVNSEKTARYPGKGEVWAAWFDGFSLSTKRTYAEGFGFVEGYEADGKPKLNIPRSGTYKVSGRGHVYLTVRDGLVMDFHT